MGRSVFSEIAVEKLLKSMKEHQSLSVGFIIGQRTSQRDLVIWICDTPFCSSPDTGNEEEEEEPPAPALKDLEQSTVAEFATQVRWCLPGGMNILGLFVMAEKKELEGSAIEGKLRATLKAIGEGATILLTVNRASLSFTCRVADGMEMKPADWKFVSSVTKWNQLHTNFKVAFDVPLDKKKDKDELLVQLMEGVQEAKKYLENAQWMIEGELRLDKDTLWADDKDRVTPRILQVQILTSDKPSPKKLHNCRSTLQIIGQLASRAYLHQKGTVGEAIAALKQDLVRSMEARMHLHTDFMVSVMSAEESLLLHETPRRVLVPFPHCDVMLSDYLFPGQGPENCVQPIRDLLSLEIHPADVNDDLEFATDIPSVVDPESLAEEITSAVKLDGSGSVGPRSIQLCVILAFSVLFAVLAVYLAVRR